MKYITLENLQEATPIGKFDGEKREKEKSRGRCRLIKPSFLENLDPDGDGSGGELGQARLFLHFSDRI